MNSFGRSHWYATGFVILLASAACRGAESESKAITIPLDQIWAYNMPGTHDVRELNPTDKDLVELIQQSLGRKKSEDYAIPGFVVQGEERDALQKVFGVLVSGKPIDKTLQANKKTWIVFFSRDSSHYVHLNEARQEANHIVVSYRFVPHDSRELTRHFALIPLGNLCTGRYSFSVVNSPLDGRYVNAAYRPIPESDIAKIVCGPFDFVVGQNPDK